MNFLQEDVILKLDNSAQIFNTLSDIPGDVTDADQLLEVYGTMQYSVIMSSHMKLNLKVDSGIYWGKMSMF